MGGRMGCHSLIAQCILRTGLRQSAHLLHSIQDALIDGVQDSDYGWQQQIQLLSPIAGYYGKIRPAR